MRVEVFPRSVVLEFLLPHKKKKGMKGKIKETADLSADFLFEVVFVLRTRLPAFVLSQELLCRIPVE